MRRPHHPIIRLGRLLALALALPAYAAVDADLEDLPTGTNLYHNGADLSGGFRSRGVHFGNLYNPTWQSWAGFAWSRVNDPLTPGWENQYAVISGSGQGGSPTYAIGYDDGVWGNSDVITLPVPCTVRGLYINNTTYTAFDLRDGSGFSKAFGGPSGEDPDWFLLTITGRDREGRITGTNTLYLADFRFTNNASDYILTNWTWVALDGLGPAVKTLEFGLTSSDVGDFGMNTPAFFALDGLRTDERYAPAAGQPESTAVAMAASNILRWATGWTNYQVGANCDTNWQTPHQALGPATGTAFDIVCLGEAGEITLTFDPPLVDGPGADFAIFENGFGDGFLELAYVEVSSDGTQFSRFFNRSLTTGPVPSFGILAPTNVTGLGSKYRQGFGEPYDLADLEGAAGLDGQSVRYVRLRDVSGNGSMLDSAGHPIYDPYLATGSAGFDLDGIAVLSNALTEVSLHPIQAHGQEGGAQALFRVRRRTWELDQLLAVPLAWSGTAATGSDYPAPPDPLIIPAHQTHVDVALTAIWDAEVEGAESVTVQLLAGDYSIRAPAALTLVLADATPADNWRAAGLAFGPDDLPVPPPTLYWNGADFGRAGEELDALVEAGLPFQVVPGVSAVEGCAAYAGIPLTLRKVSRALLITTGHDDNDASSDLASFRPGQTLAIYMGVAQYPEIAADLIRLGHDPDTPATVVEKGTTDSQRVIRTVLRLLPSAAEHLSISPPALLVVGETARFAERFAWFAPSTLEIYDDRTARTVSRVS